MLSTNGMNGKRKIKKLIETWVRFGDFLKTGLGKDNVQKAQEEQFLRLKAKIAHLLPVLTVVERGRATDPEALAAVRDITTMLNSFTTLATPEPLTAEETDEIIARWHSIFIFLNRLEGALKDRRYGFVLRAGEGRHEHDSPGFVFGNWFVRFVLSVVIIVACSALIGGLLGINLDDAAAALKKGLGIVLGTGPVASIDDAAKTQPADSLAIAADAGGSVVGPATARTGQLAAKMVHPATKPGQQPPATFRLTHRHVEEKSVVPTALRPLLRQYGKHLTMIMFAVFLAGLVFLFFLRVK